MPVMEVLAGRVLHRPREVPSTSGRPSALGVDPLARGLTPVADAPRLTSGAGELLREIEITDEYGDHRSIQIPVERGLKVVVDGGAIGKLWTLGAQPEWLVLGYLRNRQLIDDVTQIESVSIEWDEGTAAVLTRATCSIDSRMTAAGLQAEPCAMPVRGFLTRTTLLAILEAMRGNDAIYRAAGSVHACALFCGPDLLLSVEDVSRRNSFDIITGWMALHGVPGHNKILFATGRLTAEVVLKAAINGIPIVVTHKGITSACFDLAARLGMTLIGRAAQRRYICYVGAERFNADA